MNTIDRQITEEIEGKTRLNIKFPDYEIGETASLYIQKDKYFLSVLGCPRKITKQEFAEILKMFANEEVFNTEVKTVRPDMSYDDFFNKYWNGRKNETINRLF